MAQVPESRGDGGAAGGVVPSAPEAAHAELMLVLGAFAVIGIVFGVWQVLLVDMKRALALDDAQFGMALAAGFAGAYPAMYFGGRLADRYGAAALIAASGLAAATAFALLGAVGAFASLVVALFFFLVAAGAYDVGINAAGMHAEQRRGRRAMPYLHAGYSGGAAVGAIVAGAMLHAGVPFRAVFPLAALVLAAVALAVLAQRALFAGAVAGAPRIETGGRRPFRTPAIWLLAAITGMCFFGEGSVETWSALYLNERFGGAVLLAASGPAVFHASMFTGRMLSGALVQRCGSHAVLRVSGLVAAAGMLLALAGAGPVWTLAGFLLTGLALAAIAPQAFSIAGDHAKGRGGEASSLITMVGYSGFLLGPALIGALSQRYGLAMALGTLVAAGLSISLFAMALRPATMPATEGD